MRDNEIIIAVRAAVLARLAARGVVVEDVKQAQQPTQQGAPAAACIFMQKVSDVRYGSPQRAEIWNQETDQFDHVESAQLESVWQFSALAPQDPADDAELTTADYLKATAFALQSDVVLSALRSAGLGVLRIRDIRTGYTVDDAGQFQANPTFDVTFTHRDTTIDALPVVNTSEININRV